MSDEMNPRLKAWIQKTLRNVRSQPYYKGYRIGLRFHVPKDKDKKPTVRVWRIAKEKDNG